MATKTVLDIVQDILDNIGGDPVNSITDTEEAFQVARICRQVFEELVVRRTIPQHKDLDQLEGIGDNLKPNYLKLPANVTEVLWLKYNKRKSTDTRDKFESVRYLYPDEFIQKVNERNDTDSTVTSVTDFSGVPLFIRNDVPPTFYTSFDDDFIVFDSYDIAVDSTLVGQKTQLFAAKDPTFTLDDTHTPDIPLDYFPLLIAEGTSTCALRLNQEADEKAEQVSQRQQRRMSRKSFRVKGGIRYPNLGRHSRGVGMTYSPHCRGRG